jgi:hypothetical protein
MRHRTSNVIWGDWGDRVDEVGPTSKGHFGKLVFDTNYLKNECWSCVAEYQMIYEE